MKIPYERVVAYLVGPLAAAIGLGATAVVHANISKSSAVLVATFVLSSAATALGHWKWLSNLTKWWDSAQNQAAAATTPDANGGGGRCFSHRSQPRRPRTRAGSARG